jgi:hypothetical protein
MKSEWQTWKGTRFLYCDFSNFGLEFEALRTEVLAADEEILRAPNGNVLAIADLRNTVTSGKVVDLFKESATRTKGHVEKQAVVGVTGIRKILAQAVAKFSGETFVLFATVEEAKDWLASQGKKGETLGA